MCLYFKKKEFYRFIYKGNTQLKQQEEDENEDEAEGQKKMKFKPKHISQNNIYSVRKYLLCQIIFIVLISQKRTDKHKTKRTNNIYRVTHIIVLQNLVYSFSAHFNKFSFCIF